MSGLFFVWIEWMSSILHGGIEGDFMRTKTCRFLLGIFLFVISLIVLSEETKVQLRWKEETQKLERRIKRSPLTSEEKQHLIEMIGVAAGVAYGDEKKVRSQMLSTQMAQNAQFAQWVTLIFEHEVNYRTDRMMELQKNLNLSSAERKRLIYLEQFTRSVELVSDTQIVLVCAGIPVDFYKNHPKVIYQQSLKAMDIIDSRLMALGYLVPKLSDEDQRELDHFEFATYMMSNENLVQMRMKLASAHPEGDMKVRVVPMRRMLEKEVLYREEMQRKYKLNKVKNPDVEFVADNFARMTKNIHKAEDRLIFALYEGRDNLTEMKQNMKSRASTITRFVKAIETECEKRTP